MEDVAAPQSEPTARDWSLLPMDALASIFVRLGAVEVLMGAGLVCHSWLEAAKLPDVWRTVVFENHKVLYQKDETVVRATAKAAVDRSDGQLRVFAGTRFVNDELMEYILERSPSLTTLRLEFCGYVFTKRLVNAIRESPLLQLRNLELDGAYITVGELTDILESCPILEVLLLRHCPMIYDDDEPVETMTIDRDDEMLWLYFSDCEYD
ncbi:hypothetical protein CFC21_074415 [Triticum aestivum]|uniref:F-box domain-containing protein n=2 Tax=Triticum aestivum TaxID=4565 RepID=A0A3B6LWA2_WHEAT|nr:putative F-box/LRR-repeat protein 23 [Triticum aestivum]KAF7068678.1 hypothetical protein CFC21_074415 [Triticum aestivum]